MDSETFGGIPGPQDAYEERAAFAMQYVPLVLADMLIDGEYPSDVRDTHAYEVEFNSCVIDPREYVRITKKH